MSIKRFCVKFFATTPPPADEAVFIEIFHEWIRLKSLGGVSLDVADYRHVPEGPGIMLITHEINFAMDHGDGRFGLYAQRKNGPAVHHKDAILALVQATVTFAALLEADVRLAGQLSLDASSFQYIANDRLLAPNSAEGFAVIQPDLQAAANIIYPGQTVTLTRIENDSRDRLTVLVETGSTIEMSHLLEAVGDAT